MTHSRVSQLEAHFPAEFSSNPNQSYLNKPIKVFRINRKLQAVCTGEFLSRLELNSAGRPELRTSDILFLCVLQRSCVLVFSKFSSNSQEGKYRGRMKVPGCVLDIEDASSADLRESVRNPRRRCGRAVYGSLEALKQRL